jgi:hypothetical protein
MDGFKYYTLFGVNLTRGENMNPKYSKDFILRWTSNEIESAKLAEQMRDNLLFKTTEKEAIQSVGLGPEAASLTGIKARMSFCSEISAHLVHTDFPMNDEDIEMLIDTANYCESSRKTLAEAQIKL